MLKPVDTYPAGGVDSRSNPVNMPPGRYLYVRDFWPQQDGSFRLRDGYSQYVAGLQASVPIYSITPVVGPGPDYKPLVVFWQNKTPYVLDPSTRTITSPTVKGAAIASGARWSYFYANGHLHAFNGTDAKWFDGTYWRDVGLPTLTPTQLAAITVTIGLEAITPTQANAATLAFAGGGSWGGITSTLVYFAFFDTASNLLMGSSLPLTGSPITNSLSAQELNVGNLPTSATSTVVGLLAINVNGGPGASFVIPSPAVTIFSSSMTGAGTTVTVHAVAHGLSTGNVVIINENGTPWTSNGPFAVTVIDADHFSFQSPNASTYTTTNTTDFNKLQVVPNGTTSATISADLIAPGQGTSMAANGEILLPYEDAPSSAGIAASSIGGAQPGYQLYVSIYNPTTGHVGNRIAIGIRIAPVAPTTFILGGLPDFSTVDTEWCLLVGRTSDGAEVPYAIIDTNGNWISVPNGQTSLVITQSNIDGNSELPSRNYPPPGTLDYNYQLSLLPGGAAQNPPVAGTFFAAWVESDHCCGAFSGQPTIYRSGSALDMREGVFVGLPEQSWDPADIETFPTGGPITGGQGYQGESWVYTHEDCGALMELAGETSWQGPWNVGLAGQYAWARGWQNMPFWVTGDKQLATVSGGGYLQMGGLTTTAASGPIIVSDEYEAALLSQIGDEYLSQTEVIYIRKPAERVDVLRIHARDVNGNPLTIIHDFNLRDGQSPYGQAYLEAYKGELAQNVGGVTANITSISWQGPRRAWVGTWPHFIFVPALATAIVSSVAGLAAGDPIQVVGNSNPLFNGPRIIYSVDPIGGTISWAQNGSTGITGTGGTVETPGVVSTFALVRDENWQLEVLAGAPDGNLYELYSGSDDNGTNFTAQALALVYIGPERTAIKYLEWYGDEDAEFFITRDLTVAFDPSQMQALCADTPTPVQGDDKASHWVVDIAKPEMIHAYLLLQLTSHPSDGSVGLNSPPHIPLESYGRVWLVSPLAGVSRGK